MTTDERFDRIDRSIEELTRSVGALTKSGETLTNYVLDLRQETAARLPTIENRLDMLASTVANIDSRLPALTKAILDFGSLSTQLVREQSGQKNSTSELLARVVKLEEAVSRLGENAA
jgi:prefoldin subunit 5